MLSILWMLLFIPFLFLMRSPRGVKFQDYKTEIDINVMSIDTVLVKEEKKLNVLIEINNKTEKDWDDPTYEVKYLSSEDKLLNVESKRDYSLIVPANTKVNSSIKIPVFDEYEGAKLEVKLTKLSNDWY